MDAKKSFPRDTVQFQHTRRGLLLHERVPRCPGLGELVRTCARAAPGVAAGPVEAPAEEDSSMSEEVAVWSGKYDGSDVDLDLGLEDSDLDDLDDDE